MEAKIKPNLVGKLVLATIIPQLVIGCKIFSPTPATFDQSPYSQTSEKILLQQVNSAIDSDVLYNGIKNGVYVKVYAIHLKNQPSAISVLITDPSNSYFINTLNDKNMNKLFAIDSKIIIADTVVDMISYDKVNIFLKTFKDPKVSNYLSNLGFSNASQSFLRRQTNFYYQTETLLLTEYIFPQKN